MKLKDFFWEAFIKGISIESYLAYREYTHAVSKDAGNINRALSNTTNLNRY